MAGRSSNTGGNPLAGFESEMSIYRVAIVGRPNVGKSSLFNKLIQRRKAIVGNQPGITRDRLVGIAEWNARRFQVIDTGGVIPDEKEAIPEQIFRQARIALDEADLLLLVVDGRAGPTVVDESLHNLLRTSGKPFLVVVNKIDTVDLESLAAPFYAWGVDRLFPISAEHSTGIYELVEEIIEDLPPVEEATSQKEIRVAIVGRPNMGKSSLLNRLTGEERAIVTPIPGTTRDSIDSLLQYKGQLLRLIDTAGIRRKGRTQAMAEKLSVVMARKNIEQADVVILLIDASQGATHSDAVIGGYAHEAGKSLILAANKWDLVERDGYTAHQKEKTFREEMRFLEYAPMIFISAKTGQRVFKLLDLVLEAYAARYLRVPTAKLNQFVERALKPLAQSRQGQLKSPILYVSQTNVAPPTFVIFIRSRRKLHFSLERFLSNQLRKQYAFFATPIRVRQRIRQSRPTGA